MPTKRDLLIQLFEVEAIQFGEFKLRSNMVSPFYIDFRKIVSYPALLRSVCEALWEIVASKKYDFLCGVPYAALSFTSGIAVLKGVPMLTKRKERKQYGAKKLLEGAFRKGQTCLVIEDVITSGISLLETFEDLDSEGIVVKEAIVIMDREQGGREALAQRGYAVYSLFTISEALHTYLDAGKITPAMYQKAMSFIRQNVIKDIGTATKEIILPPYSERFSYTLHPAAQRLLTIAEQKKSNLICSADVTTVHELLHLADLIGEKICALKTHIDMLHDFTPDCIARLQAIAQKHNFLLFEDRKFGDIGNTVRQQYTSKIYNISEWADLITVHVTAGASSVEAFKGWGKAALVLIAEMSTVDTLTDFSYTSRAVGIAETHRDIVAGVVAQSRLSQQPGVLQFVPGVNLSVKSDSLGQQYNTPEAAFAQRGADFIIVGRGIFHADNPKEAAETYRQAGWKAYIDRIQRQKDMPQDDIVVI